MKMVRLAVIAITVFGMLFNMTGLSYAQDDDGGGDAGVSDDGGGGDASISDDNGGGADVADESVAEDTGDDESVATQEAEESRDESVADEVAEGEAVSEQAGPGDATESREEYSEKVQYEESTTAAPAQAAVTTNNYHSYGTHGYVYDNGAGTIAAAAIGAAAGAAAVNAARSTSGTRRAVTGKTVKRPVVTKKTTIVNDSDKVLNKPKDKDKSKDTDKTVTAIETTVR